MDPFFDFMGQLMKTTLAFFKGLYQFSLFRFFLAGIKRGGHIPDQSVGNMSHKNHVFEPFAFRAGFQKFGLLLCFPVDQRF